MVLLGDSVEGGLLTNAPVVNETHQLRTGGVVACMGYVGNGVVVTGTKEGEQNFLPKAAWREFKEMAEANVLTVHVLDENADYAVQLEEQAAQRERGGEVLRGVTRYSARGSGYAAHEGDVEALAVLDERTDDGYARVVTASSAGQLAMYLVHQVGAENPRLEAVCADLHSERMTGLAVMRQSCASVCEGGDVCVVHLDTMKKVWQSGLQDGLPLTAVAFRGASDQEFATCGVSPRAQLKLWDSRGNSRVPQAVMRHPHYLVNTDARYNCLASKPSSPDIFAAGTETGEVVMWDVRNMKVVSVLKHNPPDEMHDGDVWDVAFHPQRPQNMFSCGEDGKVILWTEGSPDTFSSGGFNPNPNPRLNPGTAVQPLWELAHGVVGLSYDGRMNRLLTVSKFGQLTLTQGMEALRV